jgi:serine protease AprX
MTVYNVALNTGVDYDAFWHEIETVGLGSGYVPYRGVEIANERPTSQRQCWYDLTDAEAETLRKDPRVYCVELPPEHRTDIEMILTAAQSGLYYKISGVNPSNNLAINWGLFRTNSTTNNTTSSAGNLTYNYPLDGTGVDFVVQDSGCQVDHPEFTNAAGISRVKQIDWFAASLIPGTMPATFYTDYDGHGTHVCGIAAGKTYGRAKNSDIYVMTVNGLARSPTVGLSVTNAFDCIKGWHSYKNIDPATGYKRPTVVNMSWAYINTFQFINGGNYRGTSWSGNTSRPEYGMIGAGSVFGTRVASTDVDVAELLAEGVCLVGSAGNFYQTLDVLGGPDYNNWFLRDGSQTYYMQGCTPTAVPGVICVGSVATQIGPETKSGFSDSGPRVDVYAPGSAIVSAMSTTNAFGASTVYPFNSLFRIGSISGTSMASPNVAGIVAQLLQVYPRATPAQIRQKIISDSTVGVLYDTVSTTNYADFQSLHGGPNRYAYMPFNTFSGVNGAGAIEFNKTGLRT